MVRTFIKHCDEVEDDDELRDVHRDLYDVMLSLGGSLQAGDANAYVKQLKKKMKRLENATELFEEIQPEISNHTNFQMALASLKAAVEEIRTVLAE